jgi:hypothetical protein
MTELKTRPTEASVDDFIAAIPDETRREDCRTVVEIMKDATHSEPKMWGPAIVGFGEYHYKYDSGREGDWFLAGFSPRKSALTLYVMAGFDRYDSIMARLGKYKTGKSCLYVKKLSNIDLDVLRELVVESVKHMSRKSGTA